MKTIPIVLEETELVILYLQSDYNLYLNSLLGLAVRYWLEFPEVVDKTPKKLI